MADVQRPAGARLSADASASYPILGARSPEPGARSPEPGALLSLYAECSTCCRQLRMDPDLAAEVAQRFALEYLEGRLRIPDPCRGWLRTYAMRAAIKLRRRPVRETCLHEDPEARQVTPSDACLEACLSALPGKMRRALELRHLESMPTGQAARALGMTAGAYRVLCTRARTLVRERGKSL